MCANANGSVDVRVIFPGGAASLERVEEKQHDDGDTGKSFGRTDDDVIIADAFSNRIVEGSCPFFFSVRVDCEKLWCIGKDPAIASSSAAATTTATPRWTPPQQQSSQWKASSAAASLLEQTEKERRQAVSSFSKGGKIQATETDSGDNRARKRNQIGTENSELTNQSPNRTTPCEVVQPQPSCHH